MKKIFTLIAASILCVGGVNAKYELSFATDNKNFVDGVATFTSWTWNNVAYLYGIDCSQYDYACVEYSAASVASVNFGVQENTTWTSYSEELSPSVNGGLLAIKLSDSNLDLTNMNSIFIQDRGSAGTITITSIYLASEAEYLAAKEAADAIEKVTILYENSDGLTISTSDNWNQGGNGESWLGSIDVTDYNAIVLVLASSTGTPPFYVQDPDYSNVVELSIAASDEPATYFGDLSAVSTIVQWAFGNGGDGTEVVVTKIYLTSQTVDELTTGIDSPVVESTATSAAVYNLAGQQVSESYKGVVVKNGKKVLQK